MIPSNVRLKKRCEYTLRRLNSLDELFKPADDILDKAEREKRGAAAVVGIAAKMLPVLAKFGMKCAVPLMSTWKSREIVQMEKELKVNKHDLDKLINSGEYLGYTKEGVETLMKNIIKDLDGASYSNHRDWALHALLDRLDMKIADVTRMLEAAYDGKCSVDTLLRLNLKTVVQEIEDQAAKLGMEPVYRRPLDLLQLDCSFVEQDGGFDVILFIPLVRPSHILTLYRRYAYMYLLFN